MEQTGVITQTICQQCEDAACIVACPVSAIHKNESVGTTEIDHELCTTCQACIEECPYKSIYFDETEDKIIACDLCGGDPKCVMYCQTEAIEFLEKYSFAMQKKSDPRP
jgi:Fe-S-cluster-containing dehydrogenase component